MSRNARSFYRARARFLSWALVVGCLLPAGLVWAAEPDLAPESEASSRVVIVQNPGAMAAYIPHQETLVTMINRALTNLTGKPTPVAAWRSLVSTQDVVGLKVYSAPGPRAGTRPAVVAALVEGLMAAGLPPTNIIVWDRRREDLLRAGYFEMAARYGIQVEGSMNAGYDPTNFYERPLIVPLVVGDFEFGKTGEEVGRKSFVSKLITQRLKKIINVSPLLNHYRAGVTGNLFSLAFGSVDNARRFEVNRTEFTRAMLEIYALESVGDLVVLNVVDALLCQYEGGDTSLLQYSATLNELRFSTDPVALDVLSLLELDRQRQATSKAYNLTNIIEIYQKASMLELGVSEPANIEVERMKND